jgi:hypothetical protein
MPEHTTLSVFKDIGGIFRFGSGLLGKSSIVLVALIAAGATAMWRLRSDWAILTVVVLLVLVFVLWYHRLIKFAHAHPDVAVLEGVEYTAHHKMVLAAAKGQPPVDSRDSRLGLMKPKSEQREGE